MLIIGATSSLSKLKSNQNTEICNSGAKNDVLCVLEKKTKLNLTQSQSDSVVADGH